MLTHALEMLFLHSKLLHQIIFPPEIPTGDGNAYSKRSIAIVSASAV